MGNSATTNSNTAQNTATNTNAATNYASNTGSNSAQNTANTTNTQAASGPSQAAQALINAGTGTGTTLANLAAFQNPYTQNVLNSQVALENQQNAVQQQNLLGNAASQGALGGDRVAAAQALLAGQQQLANNATNANILQQGFNTALGAAQTQAGQNLQGAGLAGTQSSTGTQQLGSTQGQQASTTAGATQSAQSQAQAQAGSGSSTTQQNLGPLSIAGLGAGLLSDERAKENIHPIGKTFDGQTIHKFNYVGNPGTTHLGLLAQEVQKHHPQAVYTGPDGFKMVDYEEATGAAADKGKFADGGVARRRDDGGQVQVTGPDGQTYSVPSSALATYASAGLTPQQGVQLGQTLRGFLGGSSASPSSSTGGQSSSLASLGGGGGGNMSPMQAYQFGAQLNKLAGNAGDYLNNQLFGSNSGSGLGTNIVNSVGSGLSDLGSALGLASGGSASTPSSSSFYTPVSAPAAPASGSVGALPSSAFYTPATIAPVEAATPSVAWPSVPTPSVAAPTVAQAVMPSVPFPSVPSTGKGSFLARGGKVKGYDDGGDVDAGGDAGDIPPAFKEFLAKQQEADNAAPAAQPQNAGTVPPPEPSLAALATPMGANQPPAAAPAVAPIVPTASPVTPAVAPPVATPAQAAPLQGRQAVVKSMIDTATAEGMSPSAIRGVLANVKDESGFDPTLRHPDQPRWGGEAHYAHGLFQEGGAEWNHYSDWLKQNHPDADWRNPVLQTKFLAQNLRENYPDVWKTMNEGTPEQAATAFLSGYLKPAKEFEAARTAQYNKNVPSVEDFLSGAAKDIKTGIGNIYDRAASVFRAPTSQTAPGQANAPTLLERLSGVNFGQGAHDVMNTLGRMSPLLLAAGMQNPAWMTGPQEIALRQQQQNLERGKMLYEAMMPKPIGQHVIYDNFMMPHVVQEYGTPSPEARAAMASGDFSKLAASGFSPLAGTSQAEASTLPAPSTGIPQGMSGQDAMDWLKRSNPTMAGRVQEFIDGRAQIPSGRGLQPQDRQALAMAEQITEGKISQANYPAMSKAVNSFYGSGKDRQNIQALGTAIYHTAKWDQAIDKLGNYSDYSMLNAPRNLIREQTSPEFRKAVGEFEPLKTAMIDEVNRAVKGGMITVTEGEEWKHQISTNAAPDKLHQVAHTFADILNGRLEQVVGTYNQEMHKNPGDYGYKTAEDFFTPETKKLWEEIKGTQNAPAPSVPRPSGMSDAQLKESARAAIAGGKDPTAVNAQLQAWGVK